MKLFFIIKAHRRFRQLDADNQHKNAQTKGGHGEQQEDPRRTEVTFGEISVRGGV